MKKHLNNPDKCTACTVCVAHCPVTAATRKFRGPKMVGPALERMRLSQDEYELSLDYCTNCKNCDMACPSGVPISTLNMLARAKYYNKCKPRLRDRLLSHGEQMGKISESFPAVLTNMGMAIGRKLGLMDLIGISGKAPVPRYADKSFIKQFKQLRQQSYPDKVVFYVGCYINFNDPQVGLDIVDVMQANKYEVIVDEDFVCCGSPLIVNGFFDEAKQNVRRNTEVLKKQIELGYPIITGCTSCLLMLKQEYQELFTLEQLSDNAKHLYDTSEFLLKLHEEGRLNTKLGRLDEQYLYHAPCHLRAQGMGLPALDLLEMIPGLTIQDAAAGCCGISGSYGLKADKYDIAMTIGQKLFNRIKASGAGAVISECGTCRLQIEHGSGAKTIHPISVLRKAYEGNNQI